LHVIDKPPRFQYFAMATPSLQALTAEMSWAHVFMTRTDPYPSQQTRNPS